ncbi:MAG: type III-B CRISPR-associated protein Cas10/Cmr2 [Anaerolineales bacterium]
MKYLMIVSIGPVQEFIATARRSRDLWYGSWMLSELSKAAAKRIKDPDLAGELIFPYPPDESAFDPGTSFIAPNKIVAIVSGDPNTAGNSIRSAVAARLGALWSDARSHIRGEINEDLAKRQIDDLLEFYWVSTPYKDNYLEARNTAEYLFAARKTTRTFKQIDGGVIPKSSLDGARESVIPGSKYPKRNDPDADRKITNLYLQYHARRGEQLSGVDLLKRLGSPDGSPKFKSTSDMAAIPFLEQIKDGKGMELVKHIRALLPGDRDTLDDPDEGLVFERRFEDSFPLQQVTEDLRQKYEALLKQYSNGLQPNPYYALLVADGDNMGVIIDAQEGKESHQRLSKMMSEFASEVPGIVKTAKGVCIYTGGDDVMAYLPLHTVMECARKLESAFASQMKDFVATDDGQQPITATLSIGIAVVHHLEPLSDALKLVRQAEKEAKSIKGKNGLAVILSKRGGADRTIVGKFGALSKRFDALMQFSRDDALSGGAAYELQELHLTLSQTNVPPEGRAREAIRIMARKRESGSDKVIDPKLVGEFEKWFKEVPLDELAREMIVAKMFAGTEEAK